MMSLEALNERVNTDLSYLAYGGADWVRPVEHAEGHVYDVVIVGRGPERAWCGFWLAARTDLESADYR